MAAPEHMRLRGSSRCIMHMATGPRLRLRRPCRKHLGISDHVDVDAARPILGRKELGGDDDDHVVPGTVHAIHDGDDAWGDEKGEDGVGDEEAQDGEAGEEGRGNDGNEDGRGREYHYLGVDALENALEEFDLDYLLDNIESDIMVVPHPTVDTAAPTVALGACGPSEREDYERIPASLTAWHRRAMLRQGW